MAETVFQHDSALFCARPCGVFALFTVALSAVSVVVSCPAPSSCCDINNIMNIKYCQYAHNGGLLHNLNGLKPEISAADTWDKYHLP